MSTPNRAVRVLLAGVIVLQAFCPAASADHFVAKLKRLVGEVEYTGEPPLMGCDSSMEMLAENIDWLEHYIDTYGSVVAKQPDIWGEARLTKHRDEYERIMFGELNQFKATINATISQGDSSFLAQAFALSNAAAGQSVPGSDPDATPEQMNIQVANAPFADPAKLNRDFSSFGIATGSTPDKPAVTLEPVIHLDQLSRYLQHLHELRRINEGDDTSDSPGYSLNLVRIPVSILPGKLTREGFGAEITVTATPVLSDDLMPTTFRNLAVNDLVDQLGLPLVRTVENVELIEKREELAAARDRLKTLDQIIQEWLFLDDDGDKKELKTIVTPVFGDKHVRFALTKAIDSIYSAADQESFELIKKSLQDPGLDSRVKMYGTTIETTQQYVADQVAYAIDSLYRYERAKDARDLNQAVTAFVNAVISLGEQYAANLEERESEKKTFATVQEARTDRTEFYNDEENEAEAGAAISRAISLALDMSADALDVSIAEALNPQTTSNSGRTRRANHPLPPSQVVDVYGPALFLDLSEYFCPIYRGRQIRWAGGSKCKSTDKVEESRVNLLDAQKWLGAELAAAHELLSQPEHACLWYQLARTDSGLADAIRAGHLRGAPITSVSAKGHQVSVRQVVYQSEEIPAPRQTGEEVPEPIFELRSTTMPICNNWSVEQYRNYFLTKLHEQHCMVSDGEDQGNEVLDQLAWAIVVESALLNQRLNDDIRKLARAKQTYQLDAGRDYNFFIPETVLRPNAGLDHLRAEFEEASYIFQEYVRVRWPIHVFAIDPREQDQNVADVSQRKREMQFALALGFATGKIGANSLTQYSRRLETQVETISLNRTIVGFGHGSDTFGWRFYPRVQALDVPGAFGVIRESFCGASRDYDLRHRQLEPGQRECVAVVLMPSFVPYADFDVRSNWFKLTNPKNAALTMKDSLRLSRAVTAMRNSRAQCARCQHLYREGELRRLFKRIDQLDRELPLQTQRALVPYENTLGGFEMFNTGVTDLAPELIGFYGAPGINTTKNFQCGCFQACDTISVQCADDENCEKLNAALEKVNATLEKGRQERAAGDKQRPLPICEGAGTSLFLVGDNFSVHDTKVIAGGVCIPHVQLISRELMRVTIPACVNTVTLCENGKKNEYVAVYVATPYGVTNHLHVPVAPVEASQATKDAVKEEVASALEAMNIAPRPASVVAGDKNNKTVKVSATAFVRSSEDDQVTTRLLLEENAGSGDQIKYEAANDPSFWGRNVSICASVVLKDKFIIPLQGIGMYPFNEDLKFPALGDAVDGQQTHLLAALEDKLAIGDFPTDHTKPLELKIVYYASIDPQSLPTRMVEEIDMEITLTSIEGGEVSATRALERIEMPVPAEATETGEGDSVPPSGPTLPSPQANCGCDGVRASYWKPISATSATGRRVKAHFAQNTTVVPQEVAGVVLESQRFSERLDRIEASLTAVNDRLRATMPTEAAERLPMLIQQQPNAVTGSTQITIRVIDPAARSEGGDKRRLGLEVEDYPLLNQMKIGACEQWRNLRDTLPCY